MHLFPYWNGIAVTGQGKGLEAFPAVSDVLGSYDALKKMFPDKPVVIGEVGWPSNGDRRKYAEPSVSTKRTSCALVQRRQSATSITT